jgi:Uma2 family endonuclease
MRSVKSIGIRAATAPASRGSNTAFRRSAPLPATSPMHEPRQRRDGSIQPMRAVMVEVEETWLEKRRRNGLDKRDELWNGVLHMPPPPSYRHGRLASRLHVVLEPRAVALGLESVLEIGLYRSDDDWRVPDLMLLRPEQATSRGASGAEVVFELLSPNDETYDKLPFYAELGVREVFVIDQATRAVELFVLRGDKLHAALPDALGVLRSVVLGVELATGPGPALLLTGAVDATI